MTESKKVDYEVFTPSERAGVVAQELRLAEEAHFRAVNGFSGGAYGNVEGTQQEKVASLAKIVTDLQAAYKKAQKEAEDA